MLDKFIIWCLTIYYNKPLRIHIFLISLLSHLFLDLLLFITNGILRDIISMITVIPFLILFTFFGGFIIRLHFINRTRTIISMTFIVLISLALQKKEVDNILLSIFQDLLFIPIIFGIFYVWFAIGWAQPDESFPTFKRWGRNLNPFKKKKQIRNKK